MEKEEGEKAGSKKRTLEEMASGQDDTDVEFIPKVKREMLDISFESRHSLGTGQDDVSLLQPSIAPTTTSLLAPKDPSEVYNVHPSVEAKEPTIKLELEEADKVEVKVEPKREE
jgi:hypothetical protein